MTLDQPWKIAALIGLLVFLRIVWGLWQRAPARPFMVELLDSGLIAFLLVFLLIRPFVVQAFYIPSASMEPTLLHQDRILVNKFIYRLNPPERGDIIVFDAPPQASPGDSKKDFVKRLIGLPGDVVQIKQGDGVYINGKRLEEAATTQMVDYDWPADEFGRSTAEGYRVPDGCYLVLGDNRNDSNDSHRWRDPVTGEPRAELAGKRVLGKAMVVFWPPWRMRLVGDNREVHLREGSKVAAGRRAPEEVALR